MSGYRGGRATRPSFARAGFRRAAPGRYVHESGRVEVERVPGNESYWQVIQRAENGDIVDWDSGYARLTDALDLGSAAIAKWSS